MIPPPPIPSENASPPPAAATAPENPRPRCEVSKFRDDYGVMWRYYSRFDFELDPNFIYTKSRDYEDEDSEDDYEDAYVDEEEDPDNVRQTLIRYVNQIRKSFGFDVDCIAPSYFNGPFHPIDLSMAKLNKDKHGEYDSIVTITDFALAQINAETGKRYELVEVEKVVEAHLGILFLTLRVKDDGGGEKTTTTIQAIGWERIGDLKTELFQWRYKPVEEDIWFQMPPLPKFHPQPPPPPAPAQDH